MLSPNIPQPSNRIWREERPFDSSFSCCCCIWSSSSSWFTSLALDDDEKKQEEGAAAHDEDDKREEHRFDITRAADSERKNFLRYLSHFDTEVSRLARHRSVHLSVFLVLSDSTKGALALFHLFLSE